MEVSLGSGVRCQLKEELGQEATCLHDRLLLLVSATFCLGIGVDVCKTGASRSAKS
jgi:hypothetical protein